MARPGGSKFGNQTASRPNPLLFCFPLWLVRVGANLVVRLPSVIPPKLATTEESTEGSLFPTESIGADDQTWLPTTHGGWRAFLPSALIEGIADFVGIEPSSLRSSDAYD